MIRMPLMLRRTSRTKASACRRSLGAAALLLGALLAAGCGQDNQRVPEDFPSGARPAPIDAAGLAAGQAELPPPPPAEPAVAPAAEPSPAEPNVAPAAEPPPPGKHTAVEAPPGSKAP